MVEVDDTSIFKTGTSARYRQSLLRLFASNACFPFAAHSARACSRGYDDPVAEAALAHKVSDEVVAAYRRTTFFDLRKRMMEDWADYCARPSSSDDTVVAFRAQS